MATLRRAWSEYSNRGPVGVSNNNHGQTQIPPKTISFQLVVAPVPIPIYRKRFSSSLNLHSSKNQFSTSQPAFQMDLFFFCPTQAPHETLYPSSRCPGKFGRPTPPGAGPPGPPREAEKFLGTEMAYHAAMVLTSRIGIEPQENGHRVSWRKMCQHQMTCPESVVNSRCLDLKHRKQYVMT